MLREVVFVEGLQEIELPLLCETREGGWGIEIENARLRRPHQRSLEERRQPAVAEVLALKCRQSSWMGQHHVGGQIVCLTSQAIGDPRTERRTTRDTAAAVHGVE